MMIITRDLLIMPSENKYTFEDALKWFNEAFPAGTAAIEEVWAVCPKDDWRIWFAVSVVSFEARQKLAWLFAGQALRYAAGATDIRAHVNSKDWQEANGSAASAANVAAKAASAAEDALANDAASLSALAAAYAHETASTANTAFEDFDAHVQAANTARVEQVAWVWKEILQAKKSTDNRQCNE